MRSLSTSNRQLEAKLGIPADDVAGAVAAFIAGNYMAYRASKCPDQPYRRLVDADAPRSRIQSRLRGGQPADKRRLYEQMAMGGTFMGGGAPQLCAEPRRRGGKKTSAISARANLGKRR
jgi:hypothetical protein